MLPTAGCTPLAVGCWQRNQGENITFLHLLVAISTKDINA